MKKIIINFCLLFYFICSSEQEIVKISDDKPFITLFCHGLQGSPRERFYYSRHGFIEGNYFGRIDADEKNIPENSFVDRVHDGINFPENHIYLGSSNDTEQCKKTLREYKDYQVIIFATSCGGVTVLNALREEEFPQIKALVLESVPHDMVAVAENIVSNYNFDFGWTRTSLERMIKFWYTGYRYNSQTPEQAFAHIKNKQLPLFIAHSVRDEIVPVRSALSLYRAAKKADFEHVYYCQLENGTHDHIGWDNDKKLTNQGGIYRACLHQFYKKHLLPSDEKLLSKLDNCIPVMTPNLSEVELLFVLYALHENRLKRNRSRTNFLILYACMISSYVIFSLMK